MMHRRSFLRAVLPATYLCLARSQDQHLQAAVKKYRYMVGTGGSGGEAYRWGAAAAQVVNQFAPDVHLTAQLTAGSGENLVRLRTGTLRIGIASNELNWELFTGQGSLPKYEHRAISAMYQGDWHWACRAAFPAKTIYEFKGKRVSFGPKGGGSYEMLSYVLNALGLDFNYFDPRYLSVSESVDAFRDGAIDAYAVGIGTPSAAFLDLATIPGGIKLISLSPSDIQKIRDKYRFFAPTTIPANTYKGVNHEIHGVGRWHFLVGRPDLPEDAAYQIARALGEHRKELAAIMSAAHESTPESTARETVIPVHAGVERYLREKGVRK
jgi:TRAP transporter TAXI family solute receptor